jgi:hypothetical protein
MKNEGFGQGRGIKPRRSGCGRPAAKASPPGGGLYTGRFFKTVGIDRRLTVFTPTLQKPEDFRVCVAEGSK